MKKQYTKPALQVQMIQQQRQILAGSPGNLDGMAIETYTDPGEEITNPIGVW